MLGRLGRRATPWLARGLKDTRNGGVDLARVGARPGKKCPLCNTSFCTTASRRANATTTRAGKKSAEDARGSAQKERYNPQEPLQYMHNPNTPSRAGGDEVLAPTLADVHLFDPENLTYEDLSSSMGDAIFGEEEEKETEKRRFSPNPRPDPKASHETADRHSVESTDISDAPEKEVAKVNALYEDVEHRKRLANNTNGDILPGTDIFGARRAAVSERTDLPEMSPGRDADEVSKELSRASDSIQVIHGKICKLRSMKKQYHELAERLHDRLEVVDQLIEVVEEEELRGKMSVSRERQKLATEFVEKHGDPLEGIDCDFKLAVTASKVLDEYFRHFDMQDYLNKRISTTEMRERTQDLILAVKNVRNEIVHESAFNELKDREAFRMTFYLAWYELDEFYDEKIAEALKRSIVSAKQIKKRISVIAKQIRDGSWGEPSVIVAEITIARAINLARAIVDIAQRRVTAGASGKDLEGSMYTGACHFRNIFLLGKQITAKYPSAIILRDIQELETLIAAMRSLVRQAEEPERESAATEPESESATIEPESESAAMEPESESATIEPESESAAMEPESGAEHENRRSRKARRDHDRQLQRLLQGDHAQEYRVKNGRKGREKRRKMARLRTKIEEEEKQ